MAVGEFVLPFVGAALATVSFRAALAAQGGVLLLGLAGIRILDDRPHAPASADYRHQLVAAVRQPGMSAALGAGFLRFVAKFALIAYLPLMLVDARGATLGQAALVLSVGSGVAAVVSLLVVRVVGRVRVSWLLMLSLVLIGAALVGFAVVRSWQLALAVAVLFGLGDGTLMVLQNALVTEAAPDAVRGGLVAVSGMTRNAGKLVAPLAIGAMVLAVSVPVSLAVTGLAIWLSAPALRSVRALDGLLAGGDESEPNAPTATDWV
jgi:predicted MFS family arabinose efflux permease